MNHTGVRSTGSRRAARREGAPSGVRLAAVSKGPLAVRWGAPPATAPQAGAVETVRVELENAGDDRLAAEGSTSPTTGSTARQPDRLGRRPHAGAAVCARRARRRSTRPCARRSRPAPTASPSTWSPRTAPGSRSSAARCSPRTSQVAARGGEPHAELPRRRRAGARLAGARARRPRRGLRRRRRRDRLASGLRAAGARSPATSRGPDGSPASRHRFCARPSCPGIELERLADVAGLPAFAAPRDRAVGLRRADRAPRLRARARPQSGRRPA